LQQPREVDGGRLALDVRVRRDDHLADLAVAESRDEPGDAEAVRADALDRVDRPAEHVVQPAELPRPLDRDDILRLLDDADEALVAAGVAADRAALLLADVAADLAEPHPLAHLGEQRREATNIEGLGLQD